MTPQLAGRRLLEMLRPMRHVVIVSVLCRVVNQSLGVAIPVVAAGAVVRIAQGGDLRPFRLAAYLAAMAVIKGLFRYLEQLTGHAVAFQLLAEMRADTYRALVPLAPMGLEEDRSGDLVTRIIGDVDRVEPFFAHTVAPLSAAVLVPIVTVVGIGLATDWVVAVTLVPFLVAILAVPWLGRRTVSVLAPELRTASGNAAAAICDATQGVREIVVFDAQQRITNRLEEMVAPVAALRDRLARIAAQRTGLGDLVAAAAVVAVAAVAAGRVESGALGLDGLAMATVAAWVVAGPARGVEEIVPDLEQSLAAAGRLFELTDRPVPIADVEGDGPAPGDGSIEVQGVTVRHGDATDPVLDDLTLDIPPGGLVALAGPSGAGKSTLVDLLLRFRLPETGTVTVGGIDVGSVPTAVLRDHIAVVPQRPELFHGTIADNLRLADPAASDMRLWSVLTKAAAADWVRSLDRGLDARIGEMGDQISGGQRQRIAIAQALLCDASIFVFDEATSELDAATEHRVMRTVGELASDHLVLFVAHRLGTVTHADRILVLDKGRLVEHGTHDGLLTADGLYATLWQRQLDAIEEGDQATRQSRKPGDH